MENVIKKSVIKLIFCKFKYRLFNDKFFRKKEDVKH